jgi:hypothetical protein
VVWDWHEDTPTQPSLEHPNILSWAYDHAETQAAILAAAISSHSYKYIHMIGHSAGARLIHFAATDLIGKGKIQQEKPFIHLTFLDAFTYTDEDSGKKGGQGYGYLKDYQDHSYAEHYVDTGPFPSTDAILQNAFNFDITSWTPSARDWPLGGGHQWPRYWYQQSVTTSEFRYGFPLSLEGGADVKEYRAIKPPGPCMLQHKYSLCNFDLPSGPIVLPPLR